MTRTAAPTFTATRTQHGKTTRVTVRDADGNVTGTRNSQTMQYVEVLVSASGKVVSASQKIGGTPNPRPGQHVVRVTDAPAKPSGPVGELAGFLDLSAGKIIPATKAQKAAHRRAVKAAGNDTKPGHPTTDKAKAPLTTDRVSAATIARDAGVDPYRFRCWLRSRVAKVDRTDIKAMRAAAKLFAKEEMVRRVK